MRPRRRKPGDIAKDACRAGKDGNLLQLRFISNYKGTRPTLLLLLIYFYKCLCMPVFICRGTKKLRHLLVKIIQVTIVTWFLWNFYSTLVWVRTRPHSKMKRIQSHICDWWICSHSKLLNIFVIYLWKVKIIHCDLISYQIWFKFNTSLREFMFFNISFVFIDIRDFMAGIFDFPISLNVYVLACEHDNCEIVSYNYA